jgi:hypothetical protein
VTQLVLLASPLLGPAVWSPVAAELRDRGREVTVAPSPGAVSSPAEVIEQWVPAIPDGPVVLVPHSNAGLYVAALAEARDVTGVVFVDALLPGEGPSTRTAEPAFREFLAGLADDRGVLPPWTGWWPNMGPLFPDPSARAAVEAEQPRLPLAYFDAAVPTPPSWRSLPAAYLGFGDSYADEQELATARGWPLVRLPGQHLHLLVDATAVATAVLGLESAARTRPPHA